MILKRYSFVIAVEFFITLDTSLEADFYKNRPRNLSKQDISYSTDLLNYL